MHTDWRCDLCGPVEPLHVAERISAEVLASVRDRITSSGSNVPLWCPWPLLDGWTVTGVAWAGDDRRGPRATAVALAGPAPLADGPADVVFVAEEPGVGLGNHLAGLDGADPGPYLEEALHTSAAHAKVRAAGHPTPLWAVRAADDRSAYVGEARAMWLYAIAWPAPAGYVLADRILLHDLSESLPSELVFGALSPYLRCRS
jgi:hypothetical protein